MLVSLCMLPEANTNVCFVDKMKKFKFKITLLFLIHTCISGFFYNKVNNSYLKHRQYTYIYMYIFTLKRDW